MRIAIRFLAILTLAALLSPEVRWAFLRTNAEPCCCPPTACMCPGQPHGPGHTPHCGMANGGQCGLESHDSYLSLLLNPQIYAPTEHRICNPLQLWGIGNSTGSSNRLPSHAQIPEQPPRAIL
jgi:hypothetical protein